MVSLSASLPAAPLSRPMTSGPTSLMGGEMPSLVIKWPHSSSFSLYCLREYHDMCGSQPGGIDLEYSSNASFPPPEDWSTYPVHCVRSVEYGCILARTYYARYTHGRTRTYYQGNLKRE